MILFTLNPIKTSFFIKEYFSSLQELIVYKSGRNNVQQNVTPYKDAPRMQAPICWNNIRLVVAILVVRVVHDLIILLFNLSTWSQMIMVDYIHFINLPPMFRTFNVTFFWEALSMFFNIYYVSSSHPISMLSNQLYFHGKSGLNTFLYEFKFNFHPFLTTAFICFPCGQVEKVNRLVKKIITNLIGSFMALNLSITAFFFVLEHTTQSRLLKDFPDMFTSLFTQAAIQGNILLILVSYYSLVHGALLNTFRMAVDNVYVIYRLKLIDRIFASLRNPTLNHNLAFIRITILNVRTVSKMDKMFGRMSMTSIVFDVPVCGAVVVQMIMGRISSDFFVYALQMLLGMGCTIVGMHLLLAQYPLLLHGQVGKVVSFNCRQPLAHHQTTMGTMSLRSKLKLAHFIEHHQTHHVFGIHYGPFGVITMRSFLKVKAKTHDEQL